MESAMSKPKSVADLKAALDAPNPKPVGKVERWFKEHPEEEKLALEALQKFWNDDPDAKEVNVIWRLLKVHAQLPVSGDTFRRWAREQQIARETKRRKS